MQLVEKKIVVKTFYHDQLKSLQLCCSVPTSRNTFSFVVRALLHSFPIIYGKIRIMRFPIKCTAGQDSDAVVVLILKINPIFTFVIVLVISNAK